MGVGGGEVGLSGKYFLKKCARMKVVPRAD